MDGSRGEKADIITYALENTHIQDKSQAVMIGDRKYDILGAKENGLDSIGVLFGFGDYEELTEAGANYIAETVEDILKYVQFVSCERVGTERRAQKKMLQCNIFKFALN